jgi:hypothetical protein
MRKFKSHSEKEKYKIARKLHDARFEGPYVVTGRADQPGAICCGHQW